MEIGTFFKNDDMAFGMDACYSNASGSMSRKDEVASWYPMSNSCAELATSISKAESDAKNNDAYVANKKNSASSRRVRASYADIIRGRIAELKSHREKLGCDKQESEKERSEFLNELKSKIPQAPAANNTRRNILIGVSSVLVAIATIALIRSKTT